MVGNQTVANATNVEVSNNIYYTLFKQSGIPLDFVALLSIRWLVGVIGIVPNVALIYVTVKNRSLYGICNVLIALNALCAVVANAVETSTSSMKHKLQNDAPPIFLLHLSNWPFSTNAFLVVGVVIAAFGIGFISLWTCFWIQVFPLCFGILYYVTMVAIGVDRLLCVLFLYWHKSGNKKPYLCAMLAICLGYSAIFVYICFVGVQHYREYLVLCANPSETFQGEIGNMLFRANMVIVSSTIICYILIYLMLNVRKAKLNGSYTQRIFKSLLCIVAIFTVGYIIAICVRLVAPYFSSSQVTYLAFVTSIVTIAAMGTNGPVLYCFSTDYRKAMQQQFPRFLRAAQTTTVGSLQVRTLNENRLSLTNRQLD